MATVEQIVSEIKSVITTHQGHHAAHLASGDLIGAVYHSAIYHALLALLAKLGL